MPRRRRRDGSDWNKGVVVEHGGLDEAAPFQGGRLKPGHCGSAVFVIGRIVGRKWERLLGVILGLGG
jgi:hypothetical protein